VKSLLFLNGVQENHVIMTNGPVITEENRVTSAAKLARIEEAVPEGLTDIGKGKSRPYDLPQHPEVKPYKFCEGPYAKGRAIRRQTELPSIRSITIVHPFYLQSSP
jgi:hypothetical protein